MEKGKLFLVPENKRYKRLEITPETDFQVWGVVTYAIHRITGTNP
jgi:DNA polymerase V